MLSFQVIGYFLHLNVRMLQLKHISSKECTTFLQHEFSNTIVNVIMIYDRLVVVFPEHSLAKGLITSMCSVHLGHVVVTREKRGILMIPDIKVSSKQSTYPN